MASDFPSLFRRFSDRQSEKDREVVAVRILSKRGVGKAVVRLPGCEGGSVVASEPTPIACGATAQAIVNRATGATTILPGPAAQEGRAVAFGARVRGSEISPSPPEPLSVEYLVLVRDGGDLQYRGITADGVDAGFIGEAITAAGAGRHVFPDAGEGLGQGTRIAEIDGDLFCLDFLNGNTFSYFPAGGWLAAAPQQMFDDDNEYWWIEWQVTEGSMTCPVRLMKSSTAKFTSPTEVTTGNLSFVAEVDWKSVKGPELTFGLGNGEAGLYIERNDGQIYWLRFRFPLDGDPLEQASAAIESDTLSANTRAGFPISGSASLNTPSTDLLPDEGEARALYQWSGQEDLEPTSSAVAGGQSVIDIARDPAFSGVWFLLADRIQHRSNAGALLSEVVMEAPVAGVGMAVLETPIEVPA